MKLRSVFGGPSAGGTLITGPIRTDGTHFVDDAGTVRLRLRSLLAVLMKDRTTRRARMAEIRSDGYHGPRVFCGDLGWAGQTPDAAAEALPEFLDDARDMGCVVVVTALTGTASGYDARAYLRRIHAIVEPHRDHVLLEAANEPYHSSQSSDVRNLDTLASWARAEISHDVVWLLGAPAYDEPQRVDEHDESQGVFWPAPTGDAVSVHLGRSRPFYEQLRHLRELRAVGDLTDLPVVDMEPIGAAEVAEAGRRESDPGFFFILGLLTRGFEISGVFHSQDGLHGEPLGPKQQRCSDAYIVGLEAIDTSDRLTFKNTGWDDSPVHEFSGGVRAYSFIAGNSGYTAHFGEHIADVTFKNGWHVRDVLVDRSDVRLYAIQR